MKTVKIIVIVLAVLTVIFFGTGLVVKESSYSVEISINKPVEETFQLFNNQELMKQWFPHITNVETIKEKPGMIGSEYRITMDNQGQVVTMKEKVLAFVENEKVTQFFDQEGVLKTNDYTFAADGSQTKIVLNAAYQGESYILNCIFPYFKGTFKGIDEDNLNKFKQFAEKQ